MSDKISKIFKSKLIFGKYSLKQLITNGTFGEVYIGTNIFNKKNYAIKSIIFTFFFKLFISSVSSLFYV